MDLAFVNRDGAGYVNHSPSLHSRHWLRQALVHDNAANRDGTEQLPQRRAHGNNGGKRFVIELNRGLLGGELILSAQPRIAHLKTLTSFHSLTEGILHPIRTYSSAHQNYDVWLDRLKQEFDPKGLSSVPNPFQGDMVLAGAPPEVITEEARGAVSKAEAGPWLGNPE